ncbi:MAG: hypothetical protein OEV15_00715 [Gallionella sp.]|nr:hypothetical protein [Gallionella sp.]
MMDDIEQAHHELDRIQGIITRHEGHMFALRGWLLTIVGGLLAAYYTNNIQIPEYVIRLGLPSIALLFLFVESRHANLVEAVVERATKLEKLITISRVTIDEANNGWYDGPKVSQACEDGAKRLWPREGMTFILYRPFYLVVILIILFTTFSLPQKGETASNKAPGMQQSKTCG